MHISLAQKDFRKHFAASAVKIYLKFKTLWQEYYY